MIKLKNLLSENKFWVRKFGEPLPTITDYAEKHQAKIEEDAKDAIKAKKIAQQLQKIEGKFRKAMNDLSDRFQADPKNHKLQKPLEDSYKKNVTKFMREMLSIVKKVK
jgi:hypothetical protein